MMRTRRASVRLWFADHVLAKVTDIGERCEDCGRSYRRTIWRAEDDLYDKVTGWGSRGLICPACFSDRAKALGIPRESLQGDMFGELHVPPKGPLNGRH